MVFTVLRTESSVSWNPPMVEVYAAKANGVDNILVDATFNHEVFHLLAVHVTGATVGMGNDHYLFYAKLVDGNEERAHGRVERADNETARIFYDFSIAVLES